MTQPLLNTNIVLAGLPDLIVGANLISGPTAINASGAPLGAVNLKSGALSQVWRSLYGGNQVSPSSTWFGGETTGSIRTVAALALCGHNMGGYTTIYGGNPVATGWWRFRGVGGSSSAWPGVLRVVSPGH